MERLHPTRRVLSAVVLAVVGGLLMVAPAAQRAALTDHQAALVASVPGVHASGSLSPESSEVWGGSSIAIGGALVAFAVSSLVSSLGGARLGREIAMDRAAAGGTGGVPVGGSVGGRRVRPASPSPLAG